MDDVRAAFRAWEAARHAKNVPVCALRQPQLGCQRVSASVPMFFISQNSSRLGLEPVYMHILSGCVSLLSSKVFQISNVRRSVSRPILVNHRGNVNIIIENYLRSDQKLTDSIRDPRCSCHLSYCIDSLAEWLPTEWFSRRVIVTCSIALILSQSDCPSMNLKCNINEERSTGSRFWTRTNCLRELQGVHQGEYSVSNTSMNYYYYSKCDEDDLVLSTQNAWF